MDQKWFELFVLSWNVYDDKSALFSNWNHIDPHTKGRRVEPPIQHTLISSSRPRRSIHTSDTADDFSTGYLLRIRADNDETTIFSVAESCHGLGERNLSVSGLQVVFLRFCIQPVSFGLTDKQFGSATSHKGTYSVAQDFPIRVRLTELENPLAKINNLLDRLPSPGGSKPNCDRKFLPIAVPVINAYIPWLDAPLLQIGLKQLADSVDYSFFSLMIRPYGDNHDFKFKYPVFPLKLHEFKGPVFFIEVGLGNRRNLGLNKINAVELCLSS